MTSSLIPSEGIEHFILMIRGQRVLLDADLARLYGVSTKRLNEQIKRNRERFPTDFMFQVTADEKEELVANCDRFKNLKHSISLPFVFTEHGAIMAANVLNSRRAIEMSVFIVRAFVKLKEILGSHSELAKKLANLEKRYDHKFKAVFDAIFELMNPPDKRVNVEGFIRREK